MISAHIGPKNFEYAVN